MVFKENADTNLKAPIVITGLHRSGTTWVGRLIDATETVRVMHEPFNFHHGLRGIPCWYPYHPGMGFNPQHAPNAVQVEHLLATFFEGKSRYIRSNPNASLPRRAVRAIVGNKSERFYRATFRLPNPRLCLKDPFCLFCVPHLVERHDARVTILVRHPAALLVSMRRMGWQPHMDVLRKQPGLLEGFGPDIPEEAFDVYGDDLQANTWFWVIASRWIRHIRDTYPDNVLIVRHENLSHGTTGILEQFLSHVGIQNGLQKAQDFLERTTKGTIVAPKQGVLHTHARNATELTSLWKTSLRDEEKAAIVEIAGPELEMLYGRQVP